MIRKIYILALMLCACSEQVAHTDFSSRRSLGGYGGVAFGTPKADAVALISGQHNNIANGSNYVAYADSWGGANFYVTRFFDDNGNAATAMLTLTDAALVRTQRECGQWYNYFAGRLRYAYGQADMVTPQERLASGLNIILRTSFSDSSYIDLYYDFNSSGGSNACTIRLYFQPPWAKRLCLVTNNRFCDINDNSIPLVGDSGF